MAQAPFPIDPVQTAIAIAFKNKRLIADAVMPRIPVGKKEFKYLVMSLAQSFTVPDTKVGRKSSPNQVSFSGDEKTGSVEDWGLDDPIPWDDINQAPENFDPLDFSTEQLTHLIMLDREVRVAKIVQDSANYGSGNTRAMSGQSKFSDYDNSNPIVVMKESLDSMLVRANIATMSRSVWSAISMHPKVVKAAQGNSGDSGVAERRRVADILELDDILVGEGFLNVARKGQTPDMQRVWGDSISFTVRDERVRPESGGAWGFTAEYGDRIAGAKNDSDIGLRGGLRNRVGESVGEFVAAPDMGYLLETVI